MATLFNIGEPQHQPGFKFVPAEVKQCLLEKYRPKSLDDVLGQDFNVSRLKKFARDPHTEVFIFEGPTGAGKTSLALALARYLEISEWSISEIRAGLANKETIMQQIDFLRFAPMTGSKYKMLLIEEIDTASHDARIAIFGAIEHIQRNYTNSLVIMTTNHAEKLGDRFVQRCKLYSFASDLDTSHDAARLMIDRVWAGEGRTDEPPTLESFGPGIYCADGSLSIRNVVQYCGQEIDRRIAGKPKSRDSRGTIASVVITPPWPT